MARNFLTGLRLVNLPTDPLSGSEGELYFNTTNDVIKIYYNGSWHTLTGINEGPADASRITAYVKNGPVALTKGVPVYATGSDGTNIIIGPSSNIAESTSSKTLGFTQTALNANQHGYIVLEGILDGLNTIAGQDGDPIWLGSASGTMTTALIRKAVVQLRTNKAVPRIGELYAAYLHPRQSADLRAESGTGGFQELSKYVDRTPFVAGGVPTWAAPAGGGKVLQVVSATTTTSTLIQSTSFTDTGLSCSITPSAATSKILVLVTQNFVNYVGSGERAAGYQLLRGATAVNVIGSGGYEYTYDSSSTTVNGRNFRAVHTITYLDSPSTTSSTTYKTQAKLLSTANSSQITFQENSQTVWRWRSRTSQPSSANG